MKNFNFKTLLLAIGLVVASVQTAWADSGFFSTGQWKAGFNNGSDFWKGYNNDGATEDLGVQTSLKLIGCNVNTWGYVKTDLDWWIAFDSEPTTRDDGQNNFWSIYVDWDGNHENYLDNNDYDLIANATHNPGNNEFYMKWTLRNYNTSTRAAKIKFTIPGFSKTTVDQKDFSTAAGGDGQSKTISFTNHYGNALNTGNCKLTGSDISDFSVTGISETGVTVKFQPSTTGTKTATLTITDAHSKKCTITLQGEAQDPLSTGVTLRGTFNSWSETANEFRRAAAGATTATTTLTLSAKQSERFLVYVDGEKYGNSGTILSSTNSAWGFDKDGADCYFNTAGAGTYTFTWDITNKKLSVTYPEETHPSSNYVYFLDDNSWGAVSAHLYDTGDKDKITNWPGQPLRTVTIDNKTYYLCAPGAKTQIIFTNGNTSSLKRLPQDEKTLSPSAGLAKYHNSKAGGTTTTWKDFEFTLTLDKNGGESDGSARVKWMATTAVSSKLDNTPTKTGYKISKFTEDQAGTKQVLTAGGSSLTASTAYTDADKKWIYPQSVTLYTQWTANDYVVTLDYNNGSGTTATKNVTYDDNRNLTQVTSNPLPTKTGQDFTGYWTKNDGTGTQLVGSNGYFLDEVSGYIKATKLWGYADNLTIYAGWANHVYSITYKDQGNKDFSGDWGTTVHPTTHTYNTATTLVDAPNKTGYTFDGWYSDANCEGAAITELGATVYTTDITLYAKWNPTTTTITLYRNDGTETTTTHVATYDGTVTSITNLTDAVRTRTGYSHNGIYAAATGGSYILKYKSEWTFNSTTSEYATSTQWRYTGTTLNLYSQWSANKYTITFKPNGGSSAETSKQATYDSKANIATCDKPTRDNYNFAGYYLNAEGTGDPLYNAECALQSNVDGYTDASGNWIHDGDVDVYAKWASAGNYVVTLTAGNDATTPGTTSVNVQINTTTGLTANITCPTKTGYTFKGYYTEASGAGKQLISDAGAWLLNVEGYIDSEGKWIHEGNVELKAKWDANKTQVTFDNQGATTEGTKSRQLTYNSTNFGDAFAAPTKTGYIFGGYFTEQNGAGIQLISAEGTWIANVAGYTSNDSPIKWIKTTTDALTLYAKWTAITYTITYEGNGNTGGSTESSTHTYDVGKALTTNGFTRAYTVTYNYAGATSGNETASAVATYNFANWTYNEKSYTNGESVTNLASTQDAEVTMTAQWNSSSVTLPTPTKTGYTFDGWHNESSKIGDAGASYTPTADITLTAQWTEKTVAIVPTVNEIGTAQNYTAVASVSPIGITTTSQLTASAPTTGYKFTGWELSSNLVVTSGNKETDRTITVRTNGDGGAVSAQAVYAEDLSSNWYLAGNGVFGGWGHENAINMTKKAGESTVDKYYAEIEITTLDETEFKLLDHSTTKYWTAENHWVNRDYPHHDVEQKDGEKNNMIFKPDMVGTYKFMLDCTESKHRLTVTFPTTTTYDVDIYYDGVTKTTVEGGAFTKQITAQVPESMRFDHWEVEGETTHVNITDINSQTTTFTASGEGAIIRAKFNTNKRIYLKGGSNFANAYINFYENNYWDADNKGTGNKGSGCVQKNQPMNKIKNTDIFWYDLNNASDKWKDYFSFVNKGDESDNFYMCNVVYRNDMKDALPFYVPRNSYANEHHNSSQYFNEGIWMKYNDTYSGYRLWIKNTVTQDVQDNNYFNAEIPGGYEFQTKVSLAAGATYEFKIYNENGTWYGVSNQTMTATSCTNWKMYTGNGNCKITASETGNYTFILNLGSGEVIVSVEYPLSASDYHVVAKLGDEVKWEGDLIKNSGSVAKKDTTSFYNNNYTFQLQQYNGSGWSDVAGQSIASAILPDSVRTQSVINFIVEQNGNNNATLAYEGIYTGNYYIRTDGVDGGWGDYEHNSDNKMENYGSLIDADPTYQYDVYKAKWVPSGKNVKFRVANDYSKAISGEFTTDVIIDNKETLPEGANVRFMWNSETNELKRAYLSGSSNTEDRYLVLEGDAKMFDKDGAPLNIAGLNANELNFEDKNNWVYQADIQAQPGCEVKLTAQYNSKVQYFIGSETTTRKIIDGSGDTKYTLRAVYDFKTNRLVAGWIPSDTITGNIILGSDMLIERTEQGDASQIVFGGDKQSDISISEIQHIYGVLKLTKESMLEATATTYGKCIYWISFPFDVKVSEIFGVEKYGEVWVISNYRGDLRAQKGWFKEDTPTFWEYLKPTDIMKANVGYTLNLDPDYFNKDSSEPWKNSATEVAWYFPSMQENIGVVSLAQKDTTLPAQHCTIDREFNAGTDDVPRMVNHKFTDSNWRVIGVPAFQNLQAPTFAPVPAGDDTEFGLTGFYEWQPTTNTYTAHTTDGYTFKATGAYMVQYEGKITWSNASAITTKNSAPWHASADSKSYSIKLEFGNEAYTDQTFVTLTEKASTDFVLNEDMMKLDNAGFPNIYSFAGNYNVAYNETKMDNQTVTLGVSAPKAGTYTFAMPNQFSGTAKLIDLVEGITTDLNISDYSVDLNKGTYNDRFQLLLEVEAKAPTSVEATGDRIQATGKTTKLLRNGNIYLINAGRVYNAIGAQLR